MSAKKQRPPEKPGKTRKYPATESKLVKQIVEAVRDADPTIWHLKVHGDGYQRTGIPDLLFVSRGRLLAVEVKHQKPGESVGHLLSRVSPAQTFEIARLNDAGALAIVAWEVEHVLDALKELERES